MKALQLFFFLVFGLHFFSACKKEKDTPTSADMIGMYEGKFGTGNNSPSSFWSFHLKANGEMEEIGSNGTVTGKGSWGLNGKTFSAAYHYVSPATGFFAVTGAYDAGEKKITGTWGYGNSSSDGGKWYMTKK